MPNEPNTSIEHPDECKIEPGCNYTVYVETTDQKIQKIVKYELPGIVDVLTKSHPYKWTQTELLQFLINVMLLMNSYEPITISIMQTV